MLQRRSHLLLALLLLSACASAPHSPLDLNSVGEKAPSEDPAILDFHSVGTFQNATLFRSAAPLRDLVKKGALDPDSPEARAVASDRMASLRARGIRTIISFEHADPTESEDKTAWIALEKSAAAQAGLNYVSCPLVNSGPKSLEDMSDQDALTALASVDREIARDASAGAILIHCSAGHDRTGIVVAYLRLKYDHWTPDRAIAEMRYFGHNWPKYSHNGGASSWHEDHVRAIASLLRP
jgi:protein tyrosine phosphatase (PTP) superfamily phosphohydrolase (DUF442 family)